MSSFIIADAFDAKQFNITMIRYKFESLVGNLIEGLIFYVICLKDIGRTMDPCWNVATKSVHVLSTIYFP